ncbi:MAG: hypothetical protein K0Q91_498 [Fibrobacteria bacterium]|nr:hypothetical protein [Fibrobacteria bacterium]
MKKLIALSLAGLVLEAPATVLQIPLTGNRTTGSAVISANGAPSPDTVNIGSLAVSLYNGGTLPAVCGAKPTTVVHIRAPFGIAKQTPDTATDWNHLNVFPEASSLVSIDSIKTWEANTGTERVAQGFALYQSGSTSTCMGAEYFMAPKWNRVVFLSFGSGVGYRAKLSFQGTRETVYGVYPRYQVLESITLYYVVTVNSTDMSGGPVALRPARLGPGPRAERDLYNPLGIRLSREGAQAKGRFEPGLRMKR